MLAAADALLIPLQCEYYALEGLSQLLNTVHLIQRSVNPELAIDGVLLTMYDARLNLSRQVAAEAREYFGRRGLRDGRSEKRSSGGGAELWKADHSVRRGVGRRTGVYECGKRTYGAARSERREATAARAGLEALIPDRLRPLPAPASDLQRIPLCSRPAESVSASTRV